MRLWTIARKAKGKHQWFIDGVTDENSRTAHFSFDFLPANKTYPTTIFADGKDASYDKNPQSYTAKTIKVTSKTQLKVYLAQAEV